MGNKLLIIVALALLAMGCGAAEGQETTDPGATAAQRSRASEPVPAELALAESDVSITGDAGALVAPGETVIIDHLVHNAGAGAKSMGFRTEGGDDAEFEAELSATSVRIAGGEVLLLSTTVTVPESALAGDQLVYDVIGVNVDDISQRTTLSVQLLVVDAVGSRPVAGANTGVTDTNEKVVVYVIGDDSDVDGDLDLASLRVIGGGFLAADISGAGDGTITYVPFANVTGSDVLLYELCDSEERCGTAVVTIEVRG